ELLEVGPRHRDADRRAGPRARAPGRDPRAAAPVAQPVDEDLPLALLLRRAAHEIVRVLDLEVLGERARERAHFLPRVAAVDRHDDVHALAAGRLRPALEPELRESLAQEERGLER